MRDYVLEKFFGKPVNLRNALGARQRPLLALQPPARTICSSSIVLWDRWFDASLSPHGAAPYDLRDVLRAYAPLTELTPISEYRATIREVEVLHNMLEPEQYYADLDALAADQDSDEAPPAPSLQALRERLVQAKVDEGDFARYLWDGRLYWLNFTGSSARPFAVARAMAAKLGERVELKPRTLRAVGFRRAGLRALLQDWELFAVRGLRVGRNVINPVVQLIKRIITEAPRGYWEAEAKGSPSIESCLEAYKIPHFDVPIPYEYQTPWASPDPEERILFLRKEPGIATRVASALRAAQMFDLGAHLSELCARQEQLMAALTKRQLTGDAQPHA